MGGGSRRLAVVFAAMLAASAAAVAQDAYPSKPVHILVPYPPGGGVDIVTRLLGDELSKKWGQTIIVENRPGAGGTIASQVVAKAPADGYTLGLGAAGALTANVNLYAQMPFDPVKDFKPVGMVAATPFVIVGHPSVPARTLPELIALAKAKPGTLSMGHGGNGTAMHLSTALFAQIEVPYRGSGPAALDALAGQVQLALVDLPASLQQIKAGKLIAFAVTSAQRVPMLPDVPTVAEAGLPGYDSTGWFGVVAPAGTPAPIVARLNAEINAALGDEQIKAAMRNLGAEPAPSSTEAFEAYIRSETKKWAKVIQVANIRLD
jgi:tripartite-type tricarboxylate transporter receptor subunit TctC